MSARPWIKFYPADWRADPRLRRCSLAARGLWIDLLCYMHEGSPYGHLTIDNDVPDVDGIALLVGRTLKEVKTAIKELEDRNIFSRTSSGIIFSRRMIRDKEKAEADCKNGANGGGNPLIRRGTVPKEARTRRFRRSDNPAMTLRIFQKSGGKCHWCGTALQFECEKTGELPHNFYHVDHVIGIKDGGTNDDDNLVAACAACNHERKYDLKAGVMVGTKSDPNLN